MQKEEEIVSTTYCIIFSIDCNPLDFSWISDIEKTNRYFL